MDVSNFFRGQKIDIECPNCGTTNKVDGSKVFGQSNNFFICTGCNETVKLDNTEARREVEEGINNLKRSIDKLNRSLKRKL